MIINSNSAECILKSQYFEYQASEIVAKVDGKTSVRDGLRGDMSHRLEMDIVCALGLI